MDPLQLIGLHGFLMWVGMGFCMPLGVILVRFLRASRQRGDTKVSARIARYHIMVLSLGLLLTLLAEVLLFIKLGAESLAHTHGRLGVALLVTPLLAALLGLMRPEVGMSWKRGLWYAAHWMLGTGTVILGIIDMFIGMRVFEIVTNQSLWLFNVAFSVQVALMALVYLGQDRWAYLWQVQWSSHPHSPSPLSPSMENKQLQTLTDTRLGNHESDHEASHETA